MTLPLYKVGQILTAGELNASFGAVFPTSTNVLDFGAIGNGVNNDTAAIQAASDAIALNGGILLFPPGFNFVVNKTIFLYSNTVVWGYGSQITGSLPFQNPTFTPAPDGFQPGPGRRIFCNANWSVSAFTDHDIKICGLLFNNGSSSGAERVYGATFHYVSRIEVDSVTVLGGGGAFAFVHCDGTNTHDSFGYGVGYSFADHWSHSTNCSVINNLVTCGTGINACAIQFTGTTGANTPETSSKFTCIGNRVYGSSVNTYSIGITATGDTNSLVNDIIISNNIVDMDGYPGAGGIGLYGGGTNWLISNNIVQNVSGYRSYEVFGNGFGTPGRVQFSNNRAVNCTFTTGLGVIYHILSDDSSIIDNDAIGCTCLTPIIVTGNNCIIRSGRMDSGTGASPRGIISGSNTFFHDYNVTTGVLSSTKAVQSAVGFVVGGGDTLDSYLEAQSWTPVLAFGGASSGIAYSTQVGRYLRIGSFAFFMGTIVLTNKGTSTGSATITGLTAIPQQGVIGVRINVNTALNMPGLTDEPVLSISGGTVSMKISAITTGAPLTDSNFSNSTNLFFSGICASN